MRDAADGRAAMGARLALSVVDAPAAFVGSAVIAAVNILRVNVHGRAVRDGFVEHVADGAVKARQAAR